MPFNYTLKEDALKTLSPLNGKGPDLLLRSNYKGLYADYLYLRWNDHFESTLKAIIEIAKSNELSCAMKLNNAQRQALLDLGESGKKFINTIDKINEKMNEFKIHRGYEIFVIEPPHGRSNQDGIDLGLKSDLTSLIETAYHAMLPLNRNNHQQILQSLEFQVTQLNKKVNSKDLNDDLYMLIGAIQIALSALLLVVIPFVAPSIPVAVGIVVGVLGCLSIKDGLNARKYGHRFFNKEYSKTITDYSTTAQENSNQQTMNTVQTLLVPQLSQRR